MKIRQYHPKGRPHTQYKFECFETLFKKLLSPTKCPFYIAKKFAMKKFLYHEKKKFFRISPGASPTLRKNFSSVQLL